MKKILPIVLTIGIIITGILAIPMGSVPIPLEYIFSPGKAPDYIKTIIFNLRLPRIIMSLLIGMMLAQRQLQLQKYHLLQISQIFLFVYNSVLFDLIY